MTLFCKSSVYFRYISLVEQYGNVANVEKVFPLDRPGQV